MKFSNTHAALSGYLSSMLKQNSFRCSPFSEKSLTKNGNGIKLLFLMVLIVLLNLKLSAQNVAVSANTGDWWSQLGQDANLPTTDGWYYRTNVGSERLVFDGTIVTGTRIAREPPRRG